MADATTPTEEEQADSVEANCADCGDVHPVGDRPMGYTTTECPRCGSTQYTSETTGDQITKSHSERIYDAVTDVRGVGAQTRDNIIETYGTYYEFEAADERELRAIDGVGRRTAEQIVAAR